MGQDLKDELGPFGLNVGVYHAGLNEAQRTETMNGFLAGSIHVLCCTNAAGMGIHKPVSQ